MYTVTFYSYKGGVGRSLLVANCALYLAQLGLRVVAIDLDLEAPGLHYKFAAAMPQGFAPRRGVVDLIFDYATRNQLYESLRDVSFEVPSASRCSNRTSRRRADGFA
jgi:Mrp family chromosome partitioning ATPase